MFGQMWIRCCWYKLNAAGIVWALLLEISVWIGIHCIKLTSCKYKLCCAVNMLVFNSPGVCGPGSKAANNLDLFVNICYSYMCIFAFLCIACDNRHERPVWRCMSQWLFYYHGWFIKLIVWTEFCIAGCYKRYLYYVFRWCLTADKIQYAAIWLASISWFSYDVTLWWRHYP